MKFPIKVYMGFPSVGTTVTAQNYSIRFLEEKYAGKIQFVWPDQCVYRIMHDFARNCIVDEFLKSDCDILWFLDSDVVPHQDVLDIIVNHGDKWEVAAAPYPVWMNNRIIFTIYNKPAEGSQQLTTADLPNKGTAFIGGAATGCLFIKRDVFAKLERPYFEFVYDPLTKEMKVGEDLNFVLKLNKVGIQTFVDYEKVCRHYKNVDLLELNNYAICFAKEKLEKYHEDAQRGAQALHAKYMARIQELEQRLADKAPQKRKTASGLILA